MRERRLVAGFFRLECAKGLSEDISRARRRESHPGLDMAWDSERSPDIIVLTSCIQTRQFQLRLRVPSLRFEAMVQVRSNESGRHTTRQEGVCWSPEVNEAVKLVVV